MNWLRSAHGTNTLVCPASFLSGITVFLGGHSKPFSFKLPVLKFLWIFRKARSLASRSRWIFQCSALSVVFLQPADEQAPHLLPKTAFALHAVKSLSGIFRVALLFICQGTSKAGFCAGAFSESLLSENVSCAKDHCATAHNEQVLLASWPCICCRFSRQPT